MPTILSSKQQQQKQLCNQIKHICGPVGVLGLATYGMSLSVSKVDKLPTGVGDGPTQRRQPGRPRVWQRRCSRRSTEQNTLTVVAPSGAGWGHPWTLSKTQTSIMLLSLTRSCAQYDMDHRSVCPGGRGAVLLLSREKSHKERQMWPLVLKAKAPAMPQGPWRSYSWRPSMGAGGRRPFLQPTLGTCYVPRDLHMTYPPLQKTAV